MDINNEDVVRIPAEETTGFNAPEVKVKEVTKPPLYLHHGIIGIALVAAGVTFAVVTPIVRPATKAVVGGGLALAGLALIWDDYTSHVENDCGIDTWFNFTPCPESVVKKVTVIRK